MQVITCLAKKTKSLLMWSQDITVLLYPVISSRREKWGGYSNINILSNVEV